MGIKSINQIILFVGGIDLIMAVIFHRRWYLFLDSQYGFNAQICCMSTDMSLMIMYCSTINLRANRFNYDNNCYSLTLFALFSWNTFANINISHGNDKPKIY